MSTLPSHSPQIKKTIAEIAQDSSKQPTKLNPNQKPPSRGSRLNAQAEAELEKFVGKLVTVKVRDDETMVGTCIGVSVNMNLVIRTDTEKIFLRTWQYIRRARDGQQ